MKIMIVGNGAREHALFWKLSQSEGAEVYVGPGNAGIPNERRVPGFDAKKETALEWLRELKIELLIVGPEAPLVDGFADRVREMGISVFGPSKDAAQLEGSKSFAKAFMNRHGIPTAEGHAFRDANDALSFVQKDERAWVVKADGLAGGKGVIVPKTMNETLDAIRTLGIERPFGEASDTLLLEEILVGPEISYHVLVSEGSFAPLAAAQDHKRLYDGDQGPNTGGMGAYSPPSFLDGEMEERILREVIEPSVRGLQKDGLSFRGVLFVGLMWTEMGPKVLEYNVRFGDPETEVLMMRWKGDALPWFETVAEGKELIGGPAFDSRPALGVVMAAAGYPDAPRKGDAISGATFSKPNDAVQVFHAGTTLDGDGNLIVNGGRVLCVTCQDASLHQAKDLSLAVCDSIDFEGKQLRRDIGKSAGI